MPSIGLYYPYIHFRDENWVRFAALYWDELHRIVPADDTPEDSLLIQELRQTGGIHHGGFIKPIDPAEQRNGRKSASQVVGTALTEFIKSNKHKLKQRYSVREVEK